MAKFLNTSAANYYLEEIIRLAHIRLILISPFLKLNDRIKELLEDKNRLKLDVRLVYGKNELQPREINWLSALSFIRTSYCKDLHATCYLNEHFGIITSLDLHDFSQVNNNEAGILISREEDGELYRDFADEANRLIRISEELRMSLEKVRPMSEQKARPEEETEPEDGVKFSTSKLARSLGLKTQELTDHLVRLGAIEVREGHKQITELGRRLGGEMRVSTRFGPYFLWPKALPLTKA
ncbi:MAG: DNA repair protein [Chthoniobacterales bacterium]|nr:DNA repair protein [Chthoniobacterales bacterium]